MWKKELLKVKWILRYQRGLEKNTITVHTTEFKEKLGNSH